MRHRRALALGAATLAAAATFATILPPNSRAASLPPPPMAQPAPQPTTPCLGEAWMDGHVVRWEPVDCGSPFDFTSPTMGPGPSAAGPR